MNRKALRLAILTEIVLLATLVLSTGHCYPLMIVLRIIHAPSAGWFLFLTDWMRLSPELEYWLSAVFAFCLQTFIWYELVCRVPRVRDSARPV